MIIKVCGLTSKTDLGSISNLNFDWTGVIFVTESKRFAGKKVFNLPENTIRVGVFRNPTLDAVLETAKDWNLQMIQLHGTETPELCNSLRNARYQVMKAIGVDENIDLNIAVLPYLSSVDYFLFDTPGGGSGTAFDWAILDTYTGETPFLLAGGIGPGFGESVLKIKHSQFKGIDLNSRFEIAPGQKDLSLLKKFIDHELSR